MRNKTELFQPKIYFISKLFVSYLYMGNFFVLYIHQTIIFTNLKKVIWGHLGSLGSVHHVIEYGLCLLKGRVSTIFEPGCSHVKNEFYFEFGSVSVALQSNSWAKNNRIYRCTDICPSIRNPVCTFLDCSGALGKHVVGKDSWNGRHVGKFFPSSSIYMKDH